MIRLFFSYTAIAIYQPVIKVNFSQFAQKHQTQEVKKVKMYNTLKAHTQYDFLC